jgi:hypothetical protein
VLESETIRIFGDAKNEVILGYRSILNEWVSPSPFQGEGWGEVQGCYVKF